MTIMEITDRRRAADLLPDGPPVEAVAAAFDVRIVAWNPATGGADALARVYRALALDRSERSAEYAVKVGVGPERVGFAVAAALAQRGIAGINSPLRTRTGETTVRDADVWITVQPWLIGESLDADAVPSSTWTALGRLLAEVHRCPLDALPTDLRTERYDHRRVTADFRRTNATMRRAPADGLAAELAHAWSQAIPDGDSLPALVDRLAPMAAAGAGPVVLCHADPHLGNVIVGPDREPWLIDWDDAVVAPVERDLLFHLGGWGSLGATDVTQQAAFVDGYGPMQPDPVRLRYFRAVRLMEDLADWAAEAADPGLPEDRRRRALDIVVGIVGATGQLSEVLPGS